MQKWATVPGPECLQCGLSRDLMLKIVSMYPTVKKRRDHEVRMGA